ncbi:polysaccharide export outer membrane protein [Rhizobium azooxidifex]|uniref:Polysaccharide export outer membrane protein n=1 Tax=Mycoplana azooxidifex TaxID=1636188 RepID=A0A7W6DDZ3_9HYPH|nr:polysaccharide biosynthesis/export family protein [Mycoplana azooxidifex]MBB3979481.1 polysaccharide export outer membrane protein [Mycoplana azooxidifex]
MSKNEGIGTPGARVARSFARLLAGAALVTLSGCIVPSDGPLTREVIESGAAGGSSYKIPQSKMVFDVVEIDQRVANSVTTLGTPSLARTFGFGGAGGVPVIGVGDKLDVTIFEAGPDGLFSTTERKSTTIPVVVQPDGRGQIPYVGSVRFAGMTIDTARSTIVDALKAKAVEPDVLVSIAGNESRAVSVQGDVSDAAMIPLGLNAEHLSEVLARAGGATKAPYDTYVTLKRGGRTGTVLLQTIVDNPKEDIIVRPEDRIYVTYDPQTFSTLGQTEKSGKVPFNASSLSLIEAAALAGGGNMTTADPKGYFVFRYENESVYRNVVGDDRFRDLLAKGMTSDGQGRYPIIYRLDLGEPQSYIVAQSFPVRNRDVIYLSRHPATDFGRFVQMITGTVSAVNTTNRTF